MNKFLPGILAVLLTFSCSKESSYAPSSDPYLQTLKEYLQYSLTTEDFSNLDWSKTIITHEPEIFIRVGFKNKSVARDFVLAKAESPEKIEGAKIIEVVLDSNDSLNGHLNIYSQQRQLLQKEILEKGCVIQRPITDLRMPSSLIGSESNLEDDGHVLAPLLMKMYPKEGSYPAIAIEYMNIQRAYNNLLSLSSNSQVYSMTHLEKKNETIGSSAAPVIYVDRENQQGHEAVNVDEFLGCFTSIPDNQYAICSMDIMVDIPVDTDSNAFFDFETGFPGHTYLQLRKTNGVQTIVRNIGFYPAQGWKKIINDGKVEGKFVDNSYHEYNAKMSMTLTTNQLAAVIAYIKKTSKLVKYDIDDYNCTDFALLAFNQVRSTDPLKPQKVIYLGSLKAMNSPQALYKELKRRKSRKPPDPLITLPGKKEYASPGKGNCK